MRAPTAALLLGTCLLGCYHATIETGAVPSTVQVEKHWASSWIYGLVPPKTIGTAQKCTAGVAKVETQLPFVNMLVGFLTLGIYTPMDIVVTCGQGATAPTSMTVPADATGAQWAQAIDEAATESAKLRQPVDVIVAP